MIQVPAVDSIRRASELMLQSFADSVQRSAAIHVHALYDSTLARNATMAESSVSSMGVFIGALGVLFAIGAIVAGFFLWQQGSDFKRERAKLLSDAKEDFDQLMSERDTAFEEWRGALERRAAELLDKPLTTGDSAAPSRDSPEYERAIAELRADMKRLEEAARTRVPNALRRGGSERPLITVALSGVDEPSVVRALQEFAKTNPNMKWGVGTLPDSRVLVRSSYLVSTKGGGDLLDFLGFKFPVHEIELVNAADSGEKPGVA